MLILDPPAAPSHRYELVADTSRTTRRGDTSGPRRLGGWVELSEAAVIPLDAEFAKSDAELLSFFRAEAATHCYHYVSFTCSFSPAAGEPFERAWLEVHLSGAGGAAAPIAWSLNPKDAWDKVDISSKASLGGEYQLLSAGVEKGSSVEGKSYFLRAYRERHKNPYWEFRSTETAAIDGTYRFHMVTRMDVKANGQGVLKTSATVLRRKFLILTSEEDAGSPPEIVFGLTG